MESLRKSFFIASAILVLLAFLVELGSTALLPDLQVNPSSLAGALAGRTELLEALENVPEGDLQRLQDDSPPGLAIPSMALLDGLILFSVALIGAPLLLTHRVHGRIQGIVTLIVSLVVIIIGIGMIFWTLGKLLLMVALFTAVPFGTISYMAVWGFFNRPGAAATLSLLMILKLGFGICLLLAHQRFLQNKGLVLILLTSVVANLIISFLHGLTPIFLVSITDAIGALIVLILAVTWAIFFLVGSIVAVLKAVM